MPQSKAELWHVHLVPARGATMFGFKSVGRKRYAQIISSGIFLIFFVEKPDFHLFFLQNLKSIIHLFFHSYI